MKDFILQTPKGDVKFNFPTSVAEISEDFLNNVTRNVKIADNYSLIALAYHETLGAVILARKQSKKGLTSGVIPMFVRAGKTDSDFINSANCKDKVIISSTQLGLGYHVATPTNSISLDKFITTLDKDNTVAARYNNNYGNEECYFVEFKIVPNCDIIGLYDNKVKEVESVGDVQ